MVPPKQRLWLASPPTPYSLLPGGRGGGIFTYQMGELGGRRWAFLAQPFPLFGQFCPLSESTCSGRCSPWEPAVPRSVCQWLGGESVQFRTQLTGGQHLSLASISIRLLLWSVVGSMSLSQLLQNSGEEEDVIYAHCPLLKLNHSFISTKNSVLTEM